MLQQPGPLPGRSFLFLLRKDAGLRCQGRIRTGFWKLLGVAVFGLCWGRAAGAHALALLRVAAARRLASVYNKYTDTLIRCTVYIQIE